MINSEFQPGAINATGCVGNGWELVKRNYGMYIGIGVVAWLIMVIPIVGWVLSGPLLVGLYLTYLRDMRNEPVNFGMMFDGFNKFGPAFLVGLIQAIPSIVFQSIRLFFNISTTVFQNTGGRHDDTTDAVFAGVSVLMFLLFLIYAVFAFFWYLGFVFAIPLVAERDIGAIDAIKLSFRAAFANFGGLFLLMIINLGISILGFLACGIGIIFAMPVVYAANAFAYRQVFPIANTPFSNAPPNPQTFGREYGQGM